MGADCSVDRKEILHTENKADKGSSKNEDAKINLNNSFEVNGSNHNKNSFSLDCKSYKDYNNKIEMIKIKIKEIIKKVEVINDFVPVKK